MTVKRLNTSTLLSVTFVYSVHCTILMHYLSTLYDVLLSGVEGSDKQSVIGSGVEGYFFILYSIRGLN
jgi:hypothetical protein